MDQHVLRDTYPAVMATTGTVEEKSILCYHKACKFQTGPCIWNCLNNRREREKNTYLLCRYLSVGLH